MTGKILDDLDLYSDLLMSIGTHNPDRPFTPIEVSDLLLRLKEETGDSLEQLSKRVGLGKKKKSSTVKKDADPTQIKNFQKLQNLSRRNAYSIGWGKSKDGKVAMTLGCDIAKLPNKDDHDILINTILERFETEKPLEPNDIENILDRKFKSPETPMAEMIEHVMSIKPKTELYYKIGITPENDFVEKCNQKSSEQKITSSELLQKLIKHKYRNNEIKSIILSKNNILWITLDHEQFQSLENEWKSKKIPVTAFFNQILMEEIQND